MGVGLLGKGKKDKGVKASEKDQHPYTDLITGVVGCSLVFVGHLPRRDAIEMARARYERQAQMAHEALDALDRNAVSVRYRRGMDEVTYTEDRRATRTSATARA